MKTEISLALAVMASLFTTEFASVSSAQGTTSKVCGVVISGDRDIILRDTSSQVWDLSAVDGEPIRFSNNTPWYYCRCITGTTSTNPNRFLSTTDDQDENWTLPDDQCAKLAGSSRGQDPIPEALIETLVGELKPRVHQIQKDFTTFNYRTLQVNEHATANSTLRTIPYFLNPSQQEDSSQDVSQDAGGLYLALDPYASRSYASLNSPFVLSLITVRRGAAFVEIQNDARWSQETGRELRDYGCLIRPDAREMRSTLMQTSHGRCREIALRVFKKLGASLIWYTFPGDISSNRYVPGCKLPNSAFVVLNAAAIDPNIQVLTSEIPSPDALSLERSAIQALSSGVTNDEGKLSTQLWPKLNSLNHTESLRWAQTHWIGCMK